jgi:hypothetical protein
MRDAPIARIGRWEAFAGVAAAALLTSIGSGLTRLNNPLGTGDLLYFYASRTLPWGAEVGGYPFGMQLFGHFQTLEIIPEMFTDAISRLSGDAFLGVNLVWLLSFPACAIVATWLLRTMGTANPVSLALGLSCAFIPYHWWRGFQHPYLGTMVSAVIGTSLALLVGSGKAAVLWEMRSANSRLRYPYRLLLLLGGVIVAWSGIYYAFFTILLLIAALLWLWLAGADARTVGRSCASLGAVLGAVVLVGLSAAFAASTDSSSGGIAVRTPAQSVTYAGSLSFLLVPSPLSEVPGASQLGATMDDLVVPEQEGLTYGQFGTVITSASLLVLLVTLMIFVRRRARLTGDNVQSGSTSPSHLGLIVWLLLVSLLFFVPWSVNLLFATWVTPGIRSWDRLLPFLLTLIVVGAGSALGQLSVRNSINGVLCALLMAVCVLDQVAPYPTLVRAALAQGEQDKWAGEQYAVEVNRAVPPHCGVLQLPYVPFPEKGVPIGVMEDYDHFLVALTNPSKNWSYGAVKSTRASEWAAELPTVPTPPQLKSLREGGFCGIHVDSVGYPRADARLVISGLTGLLGPPVATGGNGRWRFFDLRDHAASPKPWEPASLSPAARRLFFP